ncbi:transmembrane protein 134 [Nilaparvata lugens]|uniref:transmembrane protein 134 n=1 Tax=Nilaparvata lugens TaxID=108931 RepID=UPI000B99AD65|nr:transmembrane protein 134 [Nilaparvata lugens]
MQSVNCGKRFSIDDAFEEENDEAIKVYGSTTERSPLKPKIRNNIMSLDDSVLVHVDVPRHCSPNARFKNTDDTLSVDSDTPMHDDYYTGLFDSTQQTCWEHPKIRENWKVVLGAFLLLFVGAALLTTAVIVVLLPSDETGLQGLVFFIAGFICFIPGAYHVVYIYLAVKGTRGYDFYHLPLFN